MTIKAVVDSLDSVDEGLRGHYREDNGRYILDVEAAEVRAGDTTSYYALEDVNGLRSSLQKERAAARAALEKAQRFGDLDPDSVQTALSELETLRSQTGDLDEKAQKIAQSKVDQIVSKHQQEIEKREGVASKYKSQLQKLMVTDAAANAIRAAGGSDATVALLLPHVQQHITLRETGDEFIKEVIDPRTGEPRIGDSHGGPMTLEQLINEFKASEVYSSAFPGSGRSGGGSSSSKGGQGTGFPSKKGDFSASQRSDFIEKNGALAWIELPD